MKKIIYIGLCMLLFLATFVIAVPVEYIIDGYSADLVNLVIGTNAYYLGQDNAGYRAMVKFHNISDIVPSGTVTDCVFSFYVYQVYEGTGNVSLFNATAYWEKGTGYYGDSKDTLLGTSTNNAVGTRTIDLPDYICQDWLDEKYNFGMMWENHDGEIQSGTNHIIRVQIYPALNAPIKLYVTVEPISTVTNSTWNFTSSNIVRGESSTVWNTAGSNAINITSNRGSLTVETDVNSNMSCAIGLDLNYTAMVENNSNYKSATTDTTEHSYIVYDNLTGGSQCLYCSFISSEGIEIKNSSSGCLNITYFKEPSIFSPSNKTLEYHVDSVSLDFNLSEAEGGWATNETTDFAISETGVLTNLTGLIVRIYSINVTANNTHGSFNSTIFQIKVTYDTNNPANTSLEYHVDSLFVDFNATDLDDTYFRINQSTVKAMCYQESANVSTDCGSLNTGTYEEYLNSWNNVTLTFDGDWATASNESKGYFPAAVKVNYTVDNLNTSFIWEVKGGSGRHNITIPASCLNVSETSLQLMYLSVGDTSRYYCDTEQPGLYLGYLSLYNDTTNALVYEEALWQNVSNPKFSITYDGNLTNTTLLDIAKWNINVTVNDTSGNEASWIYEVNVTDSIAPTFTGIPSNKTLEFSIESLSVDFNATDYLLDSFSINYTDSAEGLCYQESANTTNQSGTDGSCGLNYDGDYTGSSVPNSIDGNWSTYTSGNLDFTINYTKPGNTTKSVLWRVKWLSSSVGTKNLNLTIPSSCFNYYNDKIVLRIDSNPGFGGRLYFQCYNGSFTNIYTSGGIVIYIHEEGVWWDLYSSGLSITSDGVLTNTALLNVSDYYINVSVKDTSDNTNWTIFNVNITDTRAPKWTNLPDNLSYYENHSIYVDFNATDPSGIFNFSINDTVNFNITTDGILTNITTMRFPSNYTINVSVNDDSENHNSTLFYIEFYRPIINTSLDYPSQSTEINTTSNISMICNISSNMGLTNVSLYITDSLNASFGFNQSKNISGMANRTTFNLMLHGNFTWNCYACTLTGLCAFDANNRSFEVSSLAKPVFCENISSLRFRPDISNYNWSTGQLLQYNVSAVNMSYCNYTFNLTNAWLSPVNMSIQVNATQVNYTLWCNGISITDVPKRLVTNLSIEDSLLYNCTLSYINATKGYLFKLNISRET